MSAQFRYSDDAVKVAAAAAEKTNIKHTVVDRDGLTLRYWIVQEKP